MFKTRIMIQSYYLRFQGPFCQAKASWCTSLRCWSEELLALVRWLAEMVDPKKWANSKNTYFLLKVVLKLQDLVIFEFQCFLGRNRFKLLLLIFGPAKFLTRVLHFLALHIILRISFSLLLTIWALGTWRKHVFLLTLIVLGLNDRRNGWRTVE